MNLLSVHQPRRHSTTTHSQKAVQTVGVTLSAVLDNKDSTAGNETVALKYTMTDSSSTNATFDYQTTIISIIPTVVHIKSIIH